MNRNEQIGVTRVRDGGPLFKRDEPVRLPRHHYLNTRVLALYVSPQSLRHIEDEILLAQTVPADRAGVVSAMARVYHHALDWSIARFRFDRDRSAGSGWRGCVMRLGRVVRKNRVGQVRQPKNGSGRRGLVSPRGD